MKQAVTICLLVFSFFRLYSEEVTEVGRPLDIPALLAGNFGELRPNHFHSGVDFKTQGRTGMKIKAIDDGYVSRATVSPWGFGRAVYVVHPETGLTSVYGHLEAFSPEIDKRVRNEQYASETFTIDLEFAPDEIPVKRGEVIALSGNAGSSFGPHLHMDIRDTATGDALDPMEFYDGYFSDKVAPEVRHLGLYPYKRKGSVNGGVSPVVLEKQEIGKKPLTAWGQVYPAINAFDRMTGTSNIYGVKYLTLMVDGKQVYKRTIDRFSFDDTRAVNTLAVYGDVVDRGRWMMKTEVPPTRPLGSMIESVDNGIVTIDQERDYKMEFILEDALGNKTRLPFVVKGVKAEAAHKKAAGNLLNYDGNHIYEVDGVRVELPKGVLYDDINFSVTAAPSGDYKSPVYTIGNYADPLAGKINITLPLLTDDLTDKNKYCLVKLKGNRKSAVGATYSSGTMSASIADFGRYAITVDTTAPVITAVTPAKWGNGTVKFKISDNLSGISTYRGEIDGKFALFELDGKSGLVTFKMDGRRFKRGTRHDVTMTVTDACGNTSTVSNKFTW